MTLAQATINVRKKIKSFVKSIVSFSAVTLLALSFRSFIAEPFRIPSGSMKNGLLIGDYIFVSKITYGYSRHSLPFSLPLIKNRIFYKEPKRGDVTVFRPPYQTKMHYIKRIIGLPGDKIKITNCNLIVNDMQIDKNYLGTWLDLDIGINMDVYTEELDGKRYETIYNNNTPKTHWSNNTREFIVPKNSFFVLGDNRNHSTDSRFSEVGFIPKNNLVGKAKMIIFSFNSKNKLLFNSKRFFKLIQ
ncbi:Signal peptidase I [Candidatus Xenohaliotis californiensis]|uniref:Signal peptidase I n=1 Tax=Candidatus Xenohaliotis californiensis TaxID=84677 RepID=A0ABP0ETH9_9RICK|nr:Signal peptidase I [Candidatus Xenohaliotis californiensis]